MRREKYDWKSLLVEEMDRMQEATSVTGGRRYTWGNAGQPLVQCAVAKGSEFSYQGRTNS